MKTFTFIVIMILLGLNSQDASAFWGSGDKETISGLNEETGFDVNTITTLSGVVTRPPESKGTRGPAVISLSTPQGEVNVIVGPRWYWEQQNFTIAKNQELTITGSRAQGKDGSFYIFAQWIETTSDHKTIMLRSESGVPFWSREGSGSHGMMDGRQGGMHQPARSGNRGGNMRGGMHR